MNILYQKTRQAFESTKFSRFTESVKDAIDLLIESETESEIKSQLKERKEKIQQYRWKLKNDIGKKETSFRNIAIKILEVEEMVGREIL